MTLVIVTVAGCSKPPAETVEAKFDLKSIALQYHEYVDQHNAPPTSVDELAEFETAFGSLPANKSASSASKTALRSGDYVVIWSYNVADNLSQNGKVILAYHKDVPSQGGYVAFADGFVKLLTKEQFAATEQAKPTTTRKK